MAKAATAVKDEAKEAPPAKKPAPKTTIKAAVEPEYGIKTQFLRLSGRGDSPDLHVKDNGLIDGESVSATTHISPATMSNHIMAMTKSGWRLEGFDIVSVEPDGAINGVFVWVKDADGVPYTEWTIVLRAGLDQIGMNRANQDMTALITQGYKLLGHRVWDQSKTYVSMAWWFCKPV